MPKVTAARGFEWYPDGKTCQKVLPGQSIEVTGDQAALLADHGHIEAALQLAAPAPAVDPDAA